MMKWLRFLVMAALFCTGVMAGHLDTKDETDAEVVAAQKVFDAAYQTRTIQITFRETGTSPWTARIYLITEPNFITWEEVGYPRLMLAVQAVLHDRDTYPKGYVGQYQETN